MRRRATLLPHNRLISRHLFGFVYHVEAAKFMSAGPHGMVISKGLMPARDVMAG